MPKHSRNTIAPFSFRHWRAIRLAARLAIDGVVV
jgi:hypothetical protein